MSIEVESYEKIRHLYEHEGMSQRAIANKLNISRNTVKKYCEGSRIPWARQGTSGRQRYVITDDILTFIKECLIKDDEENIKKQKHTAQRIYDLLVDEKNFTGGKSTIREIVATLKDKSGKAFVPLSYDPGEAIQIDWGVATVYLAGQDRFNWLSVTGRMSQFCRTQSPRCSASIVPCTCGGDGEGGTVNDVENFPQRFKEVRL
ncbi:MAG: helix-turn-helix domain-containing protein [Clostridium sp.]|nr:helix-turn-helix domain-containing protein [Clostridium sp.]MCL4462419.1 helix-turn-helix domain-containing protein [Bacillota bacterium]